MTPYVTVATMIVHGTMIPKWTRIVDCKKLLRRYTPPDEIVTSGPDSLGVPSYEKMIPRLFRFTVVINRKKLWFEGSLGLVRDTDLD